jgi:hypothetical protein
MMHSSNGWMHGWAGGGMWVWTLVGFIVVALLAFTFGRRPKK